MPTTDRHDLSDVTGDTLVPPAEEQGLELPEPTPGEELILETDLTPAHGQQAPSPDELAAAQGGHWERNTDVMSAAVPAPTAQIGGGGGAAGATSTAGGGSAQRAALSETQPPAAKLAPASMRERLSDRFELRQLLGEGGMGQVYQARDLKLGEQIAVKMLRSQGSANAEDVGRFKREIIAARRITHPNVIRIHDFGETEEETYISMELLQGGSLADRIAQGPIPLTEAVRISVGIAEGLAAAHAQEIIHRDLKPGNILFNAEGVPKLVDFGIARLATQDSTQTLGGFRGTPYYMSPEQADGREVTQLSDVYSLGVVMFEVLTGRRPFESDSLAKLAVMHVRERPPKLRSIRRDIPRSLEAIVLRALEKKPSRRYGSVAELASELRKVQARLASGRTGTGTSRRVIGLAVALALLVAASAWAWHQLSAPSQAASGEAAASRPASP